VEDEEPEREDGGADEGGDAEDPGTHARALVVARGPPDEDPGVIETAQHHERSEQQPEQRGESSEDVTAATVKTAYKAFSDSGFRMRALIKGMVEAPDFFNAPAPEPETPNKASEKVASK